MLWLAVASQDAPSAVAAIEAHQDQGLDEAARLAARMTIDLDAEESTCPACLGVIPRAAQRCPGCGLRLG